MAFLPLAQFAGLDAKVRLPEEKNIVQNPPVGGFNPPARFGIVKNQVGGGVFIESQAGQRQGQFTVGVFKPEIAQGKIEMAGQRLVFLRLPGRRTLGN